MGRLAVCVVLSFIVACSVFNLADGKCSQFGHSCFGAHGKRADDQYGSLEPIGDLYPPSNQLGDVEDPRYALEEAALANPRTMAGVRNLMDLVSQLLRQRSAVQQQQQQQQQQQRPSSVQLGPNDAYLH